MCVCVCVCLYLYLYKKYPAQRETQIKSEKFSCDFECLTFQSQGHETFRLFTPEAKQYSHVHKD